MNNEEAKLILLDVFLHSDSDVSRESFSKAIKKLEQYVEIGHWSRKTTVENVYDIEGFKTWGIKCQCDRCTFTTTVIEDFGYYKYCPNCGARMEVEE